MRNDDPTRDEMLSILSEHYPYKREDEEEEEAIYWFAHHNHGGPGTNLYAAFQSSPFRPTPEQEESEEPSKEAQWYYDVLEEECFEGEESLADDDYCDWEE